MSGDPDLVQSLLDRVRGFRWIAYVVALVLIVNGIATFTDSLRKITVFCRDARATLRGQRLTDSELRGKALSTARALMEFAESRQASEPPFDFNNFTESSRRQIRHSQMTQNEYVARFAGQVGMLRDEFRNRGKSDTELDQSFKYPTNYLGLDAIARALGTLGEQLSKRPAI